MPTIRPCGKAEFVILQFVDPNVWAGDQHPNCYHCGYSKLILPRGASQRMKNILIMFAIGVVVGSLWIIWKPIKNWMGDRTRDKQADGELLQSDLAISRSKSWRLRIRRTDPRFPEPLIVREAILPDREHAWEHVDSTASAGDSRSIHVKGDLEYIRIGDDRYFRGDAMSGHQAAPQWIKLIPRDPPPVGTYSEFGFQLTGPRSSDGIKWWIGNTLWDLYHGHGRQMRQVGIRRYSDHACLEWKVTYTNKETRQLEFDTLCIGVSDHLPYHLTLSDGWSEATYEWNPSVSIEVPKTVLPRPKGFDTFWPNI
jgi:hypothetical protein